MDNQKLAETIAEDIMKCGDEHKSPTTRIQFMGGSWADQTEKPQGGLCKVALTELIQETLERIN